MQQSLSNAPSGARKAEGAATIEELLRQSSAAVVKLLRALVMAQERHKLFAAKQPVLVAVSGGADSVCLLHALAQVAPTWGLPLHIAHLDHALRPDSAADADFVAKLAQKLNLPFYIKRLTPGILDDDAAGQEGAARSARYQFLRQVAEQIGYSQHLPATIATAHHQDDQAETLLLHLLQGSGLTGLAGMAWDGELPDEQEPPIRLVRPFLAVDRATIHSYLSSLEIPWREDSSNHDLTYLRNQLRHQVLPLLASINPNIHQVLARTADLLAAESDHAAQRDRAALAAIREPDGTQFLHANTHQTRLTLNLFHLAQYDLATQRGTLRQALLSLGIDLRTIGMAGIENLLDQTHAANIGGPHPLPAEWQWTIFQHGDTLYLSLHQAGSLPYAVEHPHLAAPLSEPLHLPMQGALTHDTLLDGWQLHSNLLAPDQLPADWHSRAQPWRLFCDAERCGELYLTTFQAGMSIAPLGMKGHRRAIGDIFTDHKIPPYLRTGWPVVIRKGGAINGGDNIVWLCGLVVADSVQVQPTTRLVRQLQWHQDKGVTTNTHKGGRI